MVPYNYIMEKMDTLHSSDPPQNADISNRDDSAVMEKRGAVRLHTMPYVVNILSNMIYLYLLKMVSWRYYKIRITKPFNTT